MKNKKKTEKIKIKISNMKEENYTSNTDKSTEVAIKQEDDSFIFEKIDQNSIFPKNNEEQDEEKIKGKLRKKDKLFFEINRKNFNQKQKDTVVRFKNCNIINHT